MRAKRVVGAAIGVLMPAGVLAVPAAVAGAVTPVVVRYVSPAASPQAADTTCALASYKTIGSALKGAPAGATIVACPGTYKEMVTLTQKVSLMGDNATIDASGMANGIMVGASGSVVSGFTVRNAIGEGILVAGAPGKAVAGVTIRANTVAHNDLGGTMANHGGYRQCEPSGNVPGDCGEGIHLMSAVGATVQGNTVTGNSGGILLSDELGPNHGNLVTGNVVTANVLDCGVTLASHNAKAFVAGKLAPAAGGVYGNRIVGNFLLGNGTSGAGAGVILGIPFPGTAVYGNLISGNQIFGNGQSGVTLHSHTPGQYGNGNRIVGNLIGTNNLKGDPDFQPADTATTGILVRSVTPLSITISGNTILDNTYGMWLSPTVTALGLATNRFQSVTEAVKRG